MEDSKEVKPLTNEELLKDIDEKDQFQRGWYQGGFYAKKRSDEYYLQELSKKDIAHEEYVNRLLEEGNAKLIEKDKEIEELKRQVVKVHKDAYARISELEKLLDE